jgi:hypothetical protein
MQARSAASDKQANLMRKTSGKEAEGLSKSGLSNCQIKKEYLRRPADKIGAGAIPTPIVLAAETTRAQQGFALEQRAM